MVCLRLLATVGEYNTLRVLPTLQRLTVARGLIDLNGTAVEVLDPLPPGRKEPTLVLGAAAGMYY